MESQHGTPRPGDWRRNQNGEVDQLVWWLIGEHRIDTAAEAQNVHDKPDRYASAYAEMCAEMTRDQRLRSAA